MKKGTLWMFAGLTLGAGGQAFGAVTILSSVTTTSAFYDATGLGIGLPGDYSETQTYTGTGPATVTTPHGFQSKSNVSPSLIYGKFSGSYYSAYQGSRNGNSGSLETIMVMTGSANIQIVLNGRVEYGGAKQSTPQAQGAYFAIYNMTTNAIVFDSYDIGTHSITPPPGDYTTWANAQWTGVLSAGTYKVISGANGNRTYRNGPGAGTYGNSSMEATMTITVPTPGTLGACAMAGFALASRRRRA